MHLSSLTLTNIRQFYRRTFNFQPGFNLLVGENGAGKTTILRGLLAALGGTQQMGRRPHLEDGDIRLRTNKAEVTAKVQFSDHRTEQFYFRKTLWERAERSPRGKDRPLVLLYASNEATCSSMKTKQAKSVRSFDGEELRRSEEFLYKSEMEFSQRRPEPGGRRFGNSQSIREFVGRVMSTFAPDFRDFYWHFEPYDCALLPASESKRKQLIDIETQSQARAFAMRYFLENKYKGQKSQYLWPDKPTVTLTPEISQRKRDERRLPKLRDIWEGMRISPEGREFLRTCSLVVKLAPRIRIRRKIGVLSLSQLSDGEQRLFSLFVDIARQLSLQNPYNEIGGGEAIVLIDEIDVHLHPKWQRRIVPALEDLYRNCQFIATTHSPFVIQATAAHKLQHIGRRLIGDISDRGIEEIAVKVMGIESPQVSVRYLEMLDTAKEYFHLLETATTANDAEREVLKKRLKSLSRHYADNPAYQAYLEIHGQLKLGPDELL